MVLNLLEKILFIREFENLLLSLFDKGKLNGTTHTCIGQEAIPVAALLNVKKNDYVISNHRGHGHYLAYGGCPRLLLDEILGKENGLCSGYGGSQHLHYKNFFSNGILGGMQPISLGIALALKHEKKNSLVFSFLGDGALGEGVVYEALNIASLWKLPVLYIVENNKYAQSTSIRENMAGSIKKRFESFNLNTVEIETNDVEILIKNFEELISNIRSGKGPACIIINTYRLSAHSKGDDDRDIGEIKFWKRFDPIRILKDRINSNEFNSIEVSVNKSIKLLKNQCLSEKVYNKEFSKQYFQNRQDTELVNSQLYSKINEYGSLCLNNCLNEILSSNKNVYLIGEDIKDPYGGAFKVTNKLSTKYPDQVFSSPISEACIVGLGSGLSLKGKVAIVEIMFGDFITLAVDQIVNHVTKFSLMYNSSFGGKLIIRTPMGGYRGYGPTHSQTLEKLFFGVFNLEIFAFDLIHDQTSIWKRMLSNDKPTVYIENKSLYSMKMYNIQNNKKDNLIFKKLDTNNTTTLISIFDEDYYDVLIFCYGGMTEIAIETIEKSVIENEIKVGVIVFTKIYPIPNNEINIVLKLGNKIIFLDEAHGSYSWGSEIIASIVENEENNFKFKRVNAKSGFIPSSLEKELSDLPNVKDLTLEIERMHEI